MDQKDIISAYGRVLRSGSDKQIVNLSEVLPINFNFQLHNINDMVTEFGGIMPPNRMAHYIMAWIKSGNGTKSIGHHTFQIQPGMGLIFPKNIIHSTNKWSLDTTGYMLTFDDSIFDKYQFPKSFLQLHKLFRISNAPYKTFDLSTSQAVESLFTSLRSLHQQDDLYSHKQLILQLAELVLLYTKAFEIQPDQNKPLHLFDEFTELLEHHFKKEREVRFYAAKLSIHANYLNNLVRTNAGMSAKDYINNRLIQEASYMLAATSVPIKQIAYDLGFNDHNYFSRMLKKATSLSPTEFREKKI